MTHNITDEQSGLLVGDVEHVEKVAADNHRWSKKWIKMNRAMLVVGVVRKIRKALWQKGTLQLTRHFQILFE